MPFRRLGPLLGLLILGLSACGKAALPPATEIAAAVEAVAVRDGAGGQSVTATGALRREREMTLSFRIPGVITALKVDDGDAVKAGQVIATLDPVAINARFAQAAAELERAQKDEKRLAALVDSGAVSRSQYDAQVAAVAGARAAYDAAAFDRRWTRLVAPASGVVLARVAQSGEVVAPGQPVVSVADAGSALVLRAPVSDRDALRLRLGQAATVTLDALPGVALSGRVSRIGEQASAQAGVVAFEVTLPPTAGLRSGMIARAEVQAPPVAGVRGARVPAEALLEVNGARGTVFVYDPATSRVRRTPVAFVGFDGDDALVTGLSGSQKVVTTGAGYVSDGQKVMLVDPGKLAAARP